MGKENYHKTNLAVVTVSDLDGDTGEEIQEKNLLREKTFNSELSSLVNKIFDNEKIGSKSPRNHNNEDFKSVEKTALLKQCESLIYRAKHAEDLKSVTSFYDPFEADINTYDDIDDTADYIKTGLLQCGFSKFQILKYNFKDKAFRSDINLLDPSYSSDMYFGTTDPVILQINKHSIGTVISPDQIKNDPFFSKKFLNRDSGVSSPEAFYLVKISSLIDGSCNFNIYDNSLNNFETFLSPLLLIELTGKADKAAEIHSELKKNASIPLMLYFLKNRIEFNINDYSLEDSLLMIELYIKSAATYGLKSYLLKLKDRSSKDNIFIFKYAVAKIRRLLNRQSLVVIMGINTAVIVTASDMDQIFKIIEKINSETEILNIRGIDNKVYKSSKEFVGLFL